MTGNSSGSPGSHPHSDRPNWQPAESIDDYLSNCREGLEEFSERRAAKVMGVSRAWIWRAKLLATIPEELFERLVEGPEPTSPRELGNVARALRGEGAGFDVETCPHCGGVVRLRGRWRASTAKVVNDWLKTAGQDD